MGLLSCLAVLATAASREVADGGTVFPDVQEKLAGILGLPADDAGRIALVRGRTPAPVPQSRVEALVGALSAPRFVDRDRAERELIRGGPAVGDALAGSREVWPGDPEARSRLERVVAAIADNWRPERVADYKTAVKLLSRRDPEGVTTLFLDVLPVLGEDALHFDVWRAMDRLARRAGAAPAVCETVTADDHPTKRAIAAYLLTRRGTERQRDLGRRALADPDTMVRLRAAQGLLGARDPAAVPALIDLLDKKPRTLAWQAEEMLAWSAGELAPAVVLGGRDGATEAERAQQADQTLHGWPVALAAPSETVRREWRAAWDRHGEGLVAGRKAPWVPKKPLLALVRGVPGARGWIRRPALFGTNGVIRWEYDDPRRMAVIGQLLEADRVVGLSCPMPISEDWVRWWRGARKPSLLMATFAGQLDREELIDLEYHGLVPGSQDEMLTQRLIAGWTLIAAKNMYGFVSPFGRRATSWTDVPTVFGRENKRGHRNSLSALLASDGDALWFSELRDRNDANSGRNLIGLSATKRIPIHDNGTRLPLPYAFVDHAGGLSVKLLSVDGKSTLMEGELAGLGFARSVRVIDEHPLLIQFQVMRLGFGSYPKSGPAEK